MKQYTILIITCIISIPLMGQIKFNLSEKKMDIINNEIDYYLMTLDKLGVVPIDEKKLIFIIKINSPKCKDDFNFSLFFNYNPSDLRLFFERGKYYYAYRDRIFLFTGDYKIISESKSIISDRDTAFNDVIVNSMIDDKNGLFPTIVEITPALHYSSETKKHRTLYNSIESMPDEICPFNKRKAYPWLFR